MNKTAVEVKSTVGEKIFVSILALPFAAAGIACWLSLFISDPPPNLWAAGITGLISIAVSFAIWWPVIRYFIRADEEGITQTRTFSCKSVRWDEVAQYYPDPHLKMNGNHRWHIEPVMLDAKGKIIFRDRVYIRVSTQKTLQQRSELWEFVEAHLQGKRVNPPSPDFNPGTLAWKSLDVNWSEKSWLWIVGRILALLLYAAFWFCSFVLPLMYLFTHSLVLSPYYGLLLIPAIYIPLLPHLMWIQWKKRKIEKEIEARNAPK